MKKLLVCLLAYSVLLTGCGRKQEPPPPAEPLAPEARFPEPSEAEREKLRQLDGLMRGSLQGLDLSWVTEMGGAAVPELARLAVDTTLSPDGRDAVFVLLGRALSKTDLPEKPDARNEVVVPALLKGLADSEPLVRRSAAFAARFVNDARLVPALRPLLDDKDIVQEQAVLALGTSGAEMEVLPVAKLFFEIDDGVFRYSCLYSLATMSLQHDVNVAEVLRSNAGSFPADKQQNLESVAGRFAEFRIISNLVKNIPFDPAGDPATRAKAIEDWKAYLLKDFWRAPSPHPPEEARQQSSS
jgi:hypothetical protein